MDETLRDSEKTRIYIENINKGENKMADLKNKRIITAAVTGAWPKRKQSERADDTGGNL